MNGEAFVDYYELLQVSANADEDTIHRVFRHLAKKYHPDVPGQGDAKRFNELVEAHRLLTNPETRAAYDARYQQFWNRTWKVASEASDGQLFDDDASLRERLLSLFYTQRRRNMRQAGLGEMQLARIVGSPPEHLEFHIWYLREKGWIQRLETGLLAVTAQGVDQVERHRESDDTRLIEMQITDGNGDGEPADGRKTGTRGRHRRTNGSPEA